MNISSSFKSSFSKAISLHCGFSFFKRVFRLVTTRETLLGTVQKVAKKEDTKFLKTLILKKNPLFLKKSLIHVK